MSTNPWNETDCEQSQESPSSLFKLPQHKSSTGNQDEKKKKRAETSKKGQVSSSIIVTVIDCSIACIAHVYTYMHFIYTCESARTRHMSNCRNKKESGFKRQHGQRRVRNVLVISSNKSAFFFFFYSNVSVTSQTRQSNRGNVSPPQKHKEVKERERRRQRYWTSPVPPKSPKISRPPQHRIIAGHYMYTTVSNISRNIQY